MIQIHINGKAVQVVEGTTILQAARQAGVQIPTLCYLEKSEPIGACRVCLVEVEGARTLMASCSTPCTDGMVVHVNSPRARAARRQVVELLLSEHDGDCQVCERNEDCELRQLASDMGIREVTYPGQRAAAHIDRSTAGLVRDNAKCVKCRRCVTVCTQVQGVGAIFPQGRGFSTVIGPAFAADLDGVTCVQCGQCAAVCPVGAITERSAIDDVWAAIDDPAKTVIVQTAPAIRAALGEEFGYEPGTRVTGKMTTALRQMGFDAVFDTNFAADLTIMEEGNELLTRLKKALVDKDKSVALPMFTSCSPGWIQFAEFYYPKFLDHLSTCKSPQQMFGAVAKTFYAQKIGVKPENLIVVSVMPCTAKKFEAQRPEMNASGVQDVDYVLTTRELARMIRQANLAFQELSDSEMDAPLGLSSGAADIFANTGGVMEAALRTAYEIVTGRPLPADNLHVKPIEGLEGIKEAALKIEGTQPSWSFLEGVELKVAVSHGLANTRRLLERIRSGEATYHFVEVMTCPGGCIGGGGQPRFTDDSVRLKRISAIYAEDESKKLRKSHDNPAIQELYKEFLGVPLGHKSHELLHTHYHARERR
ncbi:MAG: 2Fe-2S iron-sulfur cluster binding domain-containing protein [Lentisphaerae bacterium]|nr:2Fe-2S iron-sulfur cluster binding domain-containing protein [Lentisphaerota bacterium]